MINNGTSYSGQSPAAAPDSSLLEHFGEDAARRSRRRSIVMAAFLALFVVLMALIGQAWSFIASLGVIRIVHHWDQHVRSDQSDIPVIAYVLFIVMAGVFVLIIAAVPIVALAVVLQ